MFSQTIHQGIFASLMCRLHFLQTKQQTIPLEALFNFRWGLGMLNFWLYCEWCYKLIPYPLLDGQLSGLLQTSSSSGSREVWASSHITYLWQWIVVLKVSPLVMSQGAHLHPTPFLANGICNHCPDPAQFSHHLGITCSVHPGVEALLSPQTLLKVSGWAKEFMNHIFVLKHTKNLDIRNPHNIVLCWFWLG